MKLKIGSVLIALMGLFTTAAVWGAETAASPTIVNRSCQPERTYTIGDVYEDGYSCVSNAVADASANDMLDLLEQVDSKQIVVIDKPLTLKLKCSDADKCNLAFNVVSGGVLTVHNYTSFCGRFVVEGGKLSLNGGTFYTDGSHSVISTVGSLTNDVVVSGAAIKGQYNKSRSTTRTAVPAVRLDGAGAFSMMNSASIEPYVYVYNGTYTNSYNVGISVTRGDVHLDNSSVVADDYGLSIGSDKLFEGSGTFTLSNHVNVVSTRNFGIYAYATNTVLNFSIVDSTITALDGGIKLDCTADAMDPASHTVFLDGDTHINTRSAYGDYAIRECTETKGWSVTIRRGVYYRMRKYIDDAGTIAVTNKWIYQGPIVSSAVAWDPAGRDDNLTMTVTCDEKDLIDVVFDGDGGYKDGEYTWGVDKNVSTNFLIAHGGSQSLSAITAESLGMTNTTSMSIFSGWYLTRDDARALKNAQTAVSKSTTLYAGWKKCAVTFKSPDEDAVVGLASNVVNGSVNIAAFRPEQFGWEKSGCAFAGWYLDPDYSGVSVSSLSIPVATNLYAQWVDKDVVARIDRDGTTKFYKSVGEAVTNATESDIVILVQNAPDERMIPITGMRTIALNGKSLGDSAHAFGTMFVVAGSNSCLQVLGEEGTVYGSIAIDTEAEVYLDGGTYVCTKGSVVQAMGKNFNLTATGSVFKGSAEEDEVALDLSGFGGQAVLSNSTITCSTAAKAVDIAISVNNCSVGLVGTSLSAAFCGITSSNGVCSISKSSSITAPLGVLAYPSKISMSDSKILSAPSTTNGLEEAYAFDLLAGNVGPAGCSISLSGNNEVVGGSYDAKSAHPLLVGGAIAYEGVWADALKKSISGGVYSHLASNDVVMSWIPTNCISTWETTTRVRVENPFAKYAISYDLRTNLPKDAAAVVDAGKAVMTNSNPSAYTADTKYLKFKAASCRSKVDDYACQFLGWYFKFGTITNQVVAITNGFVVVMESGKQKVTDVTGDLDLIAKWGDWQVEPEAPSTIYFYNGIVTDPDLPDADAEFVGRTDENEEKLPTAADWVIDDGVTYYATNITVSLPTASDVEWTDKQEKKHIFSGWVAWYEDEDGNIKTSAVYTTSVTVEELTRLQDLGWNNDTLHAVWDQGGTGGGGVSSFEELYNTTDPTEMPRLTGGDTYVGYIHDADGVSIGTITIKCGVPQSDGRVRITATVQEVGKPTKTFSGWGQYDWDKNVITLVDAMFNGEDSISDLEINPQTVIGTYNDTYTIEAGVNKFKGSQEDKEFADKRLQPWLGKWMLIFQTDELKDSTYQGKGESDVDGTPFVWGYSHVLMDIRKNGKVALSGKLASGKDVSATATAIVGDNGVCIPVVCSVFSGYDFQVLSQFCSYDEAIRLATSKRGGFGFTAWLSGTNWIERIGVTNRIDYVNVNNISSWDSSEVKSQPFTAEVAYTNHQRVADIVLPTEKPMEFCVDTEQSGWYCWDLTPMVEKYGDLSYGYDYIPMHHSSEGKGYVQYVNVSKSSSTNEGAVAKYLMKAANKAPAMKLVDGWIVPNKGGSNYSNLKIKYKHDKGMFTGSFKVYSVKTDDKGNNHLKATKINVSGGIAEGRGYGVSYADKVGSQPVLLVEQDGELLGDEPEPTEDDTVGEQSEEELGEE